MQWDCLRVNDYWEYRDEGVCSLPRAFAFLNSLSFPFLPFSSLPFLSLSLCSIPFILIVRRFLRMHHLRLRGMNEAAGTACLPAFPVCSCDGWLRSVERDSVGIPFLWIRLGTYPTKQSAGEGCRYGYVPGGTDLISFFLQMRGCCC